jgi:dihydropteroate synthase
MNLSTPRVMGILNLTPDSFYDGGKYSSVYEIQLRVDEIINEGADIIDVGSVSTRPGAKKISTLEELKRLIPAVKTIRKKYPEFPVSVDTFNPDVAENMIKDFSVDMINDVTSGGESMKMYEVIASRNVPYIIMHMQGNPENMQDNPKYNDIIDDILVFMGEKTSKLKSMGIIDIIIDPGFGFGKTIDHNYRLLSGLDCFRSLELPVIIGISRKSMIYKYLSVSPEEGLNGTTALNMVALLKGANILRVHDVKEAVEVCRLYTKLSESTEKSQIQ